MRLSSARELKADLQAELAAGERSVVYDNVASTALRVTDPLVASLVSLQRGLILHRLPRLRRLATQVPALGVAKLASGWGLAIRVQEPTGSSRELVHYLVGKAAEEADVKVVGPVITHAGSPTDRYRPLQRGVSIGHPDVTAGTLGCFVQRPGRRIEVLSANHVLANANQARLGDPILQPGTNDLGKAPDDTIGSLTAVVPIIPGHANRADVALCELSDGVECDLGAPSILADVAEDLTDISDVAKLGRTTGRTEGRIRVLELDGLVIDEPHLGSIEFDGLVEIEGVGRPFSEPGDSGAVVTDRSGAHALAIIIGGNTDRHLSWATPLADVLAMLEAQLYT